MAAIDAVDDLTEALDALRALQALVHVDNPGSPPINIGRNEFGALMRVLNDRLGAGIQSARAAAHAAAYADRPAHAPAHAPTQEHPL